MHDIHQHDAGVVLCIACGGAWLVITASGSAYALDLDLGTATRVTGFADVVHARADPGQRLRRDGATLSLHAMSPVALGRTVYLILTGLAEGAFTTRNTTVVVEVRRLHGPVPEA